MVDSPTYFSSLPPCVKKIESPSIKMAGYNRNKTRRNKKNAVGGARKSRKDKRSKKGGNRKNKTRKNKKN